MGVMTVTGVPRLREQLEKQLGIPAEDLIFGSFFRHKMGDGSDILSHVIF